MSEGDRDMPPNMTAPTLLAIVVCDETIRDATTGKHTLVGLFSRLGAAKFPCVHPKMHVFVSLTSGHGRAQGELRLVRKDTEAAVLSLRGEIQFPDPLAVVEMDFGILNATFPEPATYSFDFYCNGALVGSRPFTVTKQAAPGAG